MQKKSEKKWKYSTWKIKHWTTETCIFFSCVKPTCSKHRLKTFQMCVQGAHALSHCRRVRRCLSTCNWTRMRKNDSQKGCMQLCTSSRPCDLLSQSIKLQKTALFFPHSCSTCMEGGIFFLCEWEESGSQPRCDRSNGTLSKKVTSTERRKEKR